MPPILHLGGIDAARQPLHEAAAIAVKDILFEAIGYPKLKSDHVTVRNAPNCKKAPIYLPGSRDEEIILKSPGNRPWQYAYQLAHEFAHMSARSDLRFPRKDGLMWIEEALAECHSLIALHHMGQTEGALQAGALAYLRGRLVAHRDKPLDKNWFAAQREALRGAETLIDPCKVLARHLFGIVDHERILRDNRLLIRLGTGWELRAFLDQWEQLGGADRSVPSALRALM